MDELIPTRSLLRDIYKPAPVCLIIPPSIFLLDERVFTNLGVLKVASALESVKAPVEVLDLSGVSNFEDVVAMHVAATPTKIFGITTTTPQMPATAKIAKRIREIRPDARLVIGGPHPTLIAAALKRESKLGMKGRATIAMDQLSQMFDCVVAGDGELACAFAFYGNKPFINADDPQGELFMTNKVYSETPWPARHLVDLESYHYSIENHRATSVILQLGCPFSCGFCGGRESSMLRKIRTRPTANIIMELEHIYKTYGYTGFMFYDDELNVNKAMVELMNEITNLQNRLGVEFRLRGFVKAELFNETQAQAMYRAGFRWLLTGFESGSPRILENINKKATREDNTRCFEIARKNNLKVKALMSIGHPGESAETVQDTHDWLMQVQPDDFDVTIITTYPGTPYYDHAVETSPGIWTYTYDKTGDKLHAYAIDYNETADYYKGDPDGGYKAYVFTDNLSSEELVKLRGDVEKSVRTTLNIPFNPGMAAANFEHSMGQGIPLNILRRSS